jgi:hypothetical protein
MKILHPDMQRIDIHSSLAFPYDDPPQEVIFARWGKDITRFNKLTTHYNLLPSSSVKATEPVSIPVKYLQYVVNGMAAYAIYYNMYKEMVNSYAKVNSNANVNVLDMVEPENIVSAICTVANDMFTFDTYNNTLDLVSIEPRATCNKLSLTDPHEYYPYSNILPPRLEAIAPTCKVVVHDTGNRLLTISTVKFAGMSVRLVSIQYLLKHFLSLSFILENDLAGLCVARYLSLMSMIEKAGELYKSGFTKVTSYPFFLTVDVYGNNNVNISRQFTLARLGIDTPVAQYKIPVNYYPDRKTPTPIFDITTHEFYKQSGELRN